MRSIKFSACVLFWFRIFTSECRQAERVNHIVFKTWIGQRLSDPRAIHTFTYTCDQGIICDQLWPDVTSCDQLHNVNWQSWEWVSIASAWLMTNLVTLTVIKCDQNMIGERSDPLAASAASQADRSVLRGAIAQQRAPTACLYNRGFFWWFWAKYVEEIPCLHHMKIFSTMHAWITKHWISFSPIWIL